MGVLDELEAATAEVARRVGPAVVGIGQGWGLGSGVVVGQGRVLTNAHNLQGELAVTFPDGRTVTADNFSADVDGDIAVLSVDTGDVTPLEWAEDGPKIGGVVFGVSNPGGRGLRVTAGQVSAVGQSFRGPRGRRVVGSLEHTAPLPRGSSGGPIVDAAGRFVGLNTNRLGEGFYAALPADAELAARVEHLAAGETPTRRRLGVGLVPGRAARQLRRSVGLADRDGILVRVVEEGGPADTAGIRRGDLIVEAAGQPVARIDDLHGALDSLADTQSLTIGLVRGADELSVTVTFPEAS